MKKRDRNDFLGKDTVLLLIIIVIALGLRLYKINTPLADYHSWRQVDTASVARNFVKNGFDLLRPTYHDLSNVQSGRENPQGYRMVEFPLYNAFFGFLYQKAPLLPLEVYGRLTSIVFSLFIIAVIYYLLLKESSRIAAVSSALIYAVFPFFVFFSRTVLPETMALSLTFISIFFLYLFSYAKRGFKNSLFYLLSLVSFAAGILIKPTVIFFAITLLYVFFIKYRWKVLKKFSLYFYFILSFLPLILWRNHIQSYPEGVPVSQWLIFGVNTSEGLKNIFFRPAFFRWIFFERINNLILGGFLSSFFVLGAIVKTKRRLIQSIVFSSLIYLLVFQGGNVQHEYYQILILPAIAALCGIGISFLIQNPKGLMTPLTVYLTIFSVFTFSFLFSYFRVKDYYGFSHDLVSISKIINNLTKEDDRIVTDTQGDTTLLYLSERTGAPSFYKEVEDLAKDYKYFVTMNPSAAVSLKSKHKYPVLFENDKVSIFRL